MTTTTLHLGTGKELRRLFGKLAESIRETVASLIGKSLAAQVVDVVVADATELHALLQANVAVVHGALDKDFAGKQFCTLVEVADACAMAGLLMLTPENVIEQRQKSGKLEGEDKEAFGELANVLCSGLSSALRAEVQNVDIRLQDYAVLAQGDDPSASLPQGALVACRLKSRIEGQPERSMWLVVDRATAETWNKAPLDDAPQAAATQAATGTAPDKQGQAAADASPKLGEDDLEDIPAAPVRGVLHAYSTSTDLMRVLRRACRRTGLDLRRHARAEVPNPAAHKGEVVLMDVPAGEDRRFDWCKRLKDYGSGIRVVLLLHRPSRARVTQAYLSQADVILGLPVDEPQLSQKLNSLLGS